MWRFAPGEPLEALDLATPNTLETESKRRSKNWLQLGIPI